jgi:hypothetical protein
MEARFKVYLKLEGYSIVLLISHEKHLNLMESRNKMIRQAMVSTKHNKSGGKNHQIHKKNTNETSFTIT